MSGPGLVVGWRVSEGAPVWVVLGCPGPGSDPVWDVQLIALWRWAGGARFDVFRGCGDPGSVGLWASVWGSPVCVEVSGKAEM